MKKNLDYFVNGEINCNGQLAKVKVCLLVLANALDFMSLLVISNLPKISLHKGDKNEF